MAASPAGLYQAAAGSLSRAVEAPPACLAGSALRADVLCDGSVDVCDDLVFLSGFGESGFDEGELNYPIGVALDAAGNVYVADTWNQRVQVFDPDHAFVAEPAEGASVRPM